MKKKVILGLCGSIAAYKSCEIIRILVKNDVDVHVCMTKSATQFITPLTMQVLSNNYVYTDDSCNYNPSSISHVSLSKDADLILISPASANFISKIANAICDDFLSSLILATNNIPILIAPAMNTNMYNNLIFQKNLSTLIDCGFILIEPKSDFLACKDTGIGALEEVDIITSKVFEFLGDK